MNALAQRIARAISFEGPLSLSAFMTLALHDPSSGFYASRDSIGAAGSFVTSPEISQVFGELLGLWVLRVWMDQGQPRPPRLVELGPGRGTLMQDVLRALRHAPEFLDGLEIVLVESSPTLETLQRQRLRGEACAVRWVRQWSDVQRDRPLFLLANEFLDALPVRQYVMTERGWCERVVTIERSGSLAFALAPAPAPLFVPARRGSGGPGAVYEISPAAEALVADVGDAIGTHGGAALFIDYGHEGTGFGDTLQAVARHAAVDVLDCPGEADISAHVDFAALADRVQRPARAWGPVEQGDFLQSLRIETRASALACANPERADEIRLAVDRLTRSDRMGRIFKVMAIAPAAVPAPPGF